MCRFLYMLLPLIDAQQLVLQASTSYQLASGVNLTLRVTENNALDRKGKADFY